MRALRMMTAGAVLCLAIAGCGGASKQPTRTATTSISTLVTPTPTTTTAGTTTFATGYEQSWGLMKQVGAQIFAAINGAKRASAHHQPVSNAHIASEFAILAAHLEPAVVGLLGLTPPASVRTAFSSMAGAAEQLAGALRSFSSDAAASRGAKGQRDIAACLAYAAIINRDATTIYTKLGLT
jgi:hypothetical protein